MRSKEAGSDDVVIEKVFQTAIAAAKKVKSQVHLTSANPSAARSSVEVLKKEWGSLAGKRCLIIGNGQIGKLLAELLTGYGAKVSMTLRKRMHKEQVQGSIIPEHCKMVPYEERLAELETYDGVISATRSPHYTLIKENLQDGNFAGTIFMDLAVPRDMDPTIEEIPGIKLFNMDQLSALTPIHTNAAETKKAEEILEAYIDELKLWFGFRKYLPKIEKITELAAEDITNRMKTQEVEAAAEKSIKKLLFGLREYLPKEAWNDCFSALEKAALKDTVKTGEKGIR